MLVKERAPRQGDVPVTIARFVSVDSAIAQIQNTRKGGRLQAAIGRRFISQGLQIGHVDLSEDGRQLIFRGNFTRPPSEVPRT